MYESRHLNTNFPKKTPALQCHYVLGRFKSKRKLLSNISVASASAPSVQELNIHHGHITQTKQKPFQRLPRAPLDDQYILGLIWSQRYTFGIAVGCALICSFCTLTSPILTGYIVEICAGRSPLSEYPKFLIGLAILYAVEPIMSALYCAKVIKGSEQVMQLLRQEVFRNILMQKIDFFDQYSSSKLTGLISNELRTLRSLVVGNSSRDRGLRAVLEVIGCVSILAFVSWRLGPIIAIITISMAISTSVYKVMTKSAEANSSKTTDEMNEVANEVIGSMRTVRSFGAESLERESFKRFSRDSYKSGVTLGRAKGLSESITRGSIHLAIVILFAYGGNLVIQGILPIRTLIIGLSYIYSLVFSTQGLTQTYIDWRKTQASLARIREILQSQQPDLKMAQALPPGAWWMIANKDIQIEQSRQQSSNGLNEESYLQEGDIELKNVSFTYPLRPEKKVLKGLNLTLKKGTVTALVGHSGAGKSTIASMLSRFYQPTEGQITINGEDIYQYDQKDWCEMVAMVSQEPVLFSGSIRDNIAYGKFGHASQAAIQKAAMAANAHDFIMDMPDQYDTYVGPGGGLLSGGQRQRVALARALLKDSPVIILDEATNALDATNEKLVREATERLIQGKTVLIIAHRLSTIQNADYIVVMESGEVAEQGTHEQLIEKSGKYVSLVCSQDVMWSGQVVCPIG
eukprot:TRINITY_DN7264_c0_g1_i1.p1 TRINITY_DN7264_c0_g1~~TRINITY_DN7264_c0_g1_i1.p1  ORF type:complete len:688 (-),score=106.05 TRINITY_DN7264_c0_g1_i1:202-2265(-)